MSYQVKLDTFEGPLDLLLHLIDKEEMDIYDIQISKITDQYLEYLDTMQSLKLDIASEFLVMASTLLSIKSKMLLPSRNEHSFQGSFILDVEEDPRDELVRRLIEYKKYKEVSMALREKELARSKIFTKAPSDLLPYVEVGEVNPVEGISIYHLIETFQKALKRYSYKEPISKVSREEISMKDRMEQIIQILQSSGRELFFSDLLADVYCRSEIVITFLSLLELIKQKQIICIQKNPFDDIVIQYSP
ncbi:segregation and condensation protein A [Tepidibacillus fermentans]|uniref:Segregation and condensation protein A n=1 Tax=Tepidibacillus fermentans TaxID=1281767 RepID=A0A4R3KJZ1_9BACI|nr:segregation/condensation protein A [Tepidibacillus fermentans]TCS84093.1 condensin subunit ScpA [Tepidibacillus fermentans]